MYVCMYVCMYVTRSVRVKFGSVRFASRVKVWLTQGGLHTTWPHLLLEAAADCPCSWWPPCPHVLLSERNLRPFWSRYLILWDISLKASMTNYLTKLQSCDWHSVVVDSAFHRWARQSHLEPSSVVGSTEHGKSSFPKGCRHIVGYMIIIYLSMSDIKAYIFASYDISTSPPMHTPRCSHRGAA